MSFELNPEDGIIFATVMLTRLNKTKEIINTVKVFPELNLMDAKINIGRIAVRTSKPIESNVQSDPYSGLLSEDEFVSIAFVAKTKIKNLASLRKLLKNFDARTVFSRTSFEMLYLHVEKMQEEPLMDLNEDEPVTTN